MIRHPDGRRWIGYKVGTYVAERAMRENVTQTERMRIAADLAKSAIAAYTGVPAKDGGSGGGGSHSQVGAMVNYFD